MSAYIVTFYTHYGAIKFAKLCESRSVPCKLMPVPRRLSASCGTCARFEAETLSFITFDEDLERCYLVSGKDIYQRVVLPQNQGAD